MTKLDHRHIEVLRQLSTKKTTTPAEIAQTTHMGPSAVGRLLSTLVWAGMATRRMDGKGVSHFKRTRKGGQALQTLGISNTVAYRGQNHIYFSIKGQLAASLTAEEAHSLSEWLTDAVKRLGGQK